MEHTDTVVYYGGAIKALNDDERRIGGYAIRFGSEEDRDLDGQWFSAKTYLGANGGNNVDVMINHGIPLSKDLAAWGKVFLPPVKARTDQVGLFVETVIKLSDQYREMLSQKYGMTAADFERWEEETYRAVKSGRLGWSSGSAAHTIDFTPEGEITCWPIIEHSPPHR
jgi:hypothetical protein